MYTLSNKQLAQYLVRQDKGFIISNENIHLNDSEDWVRIPLSHTELKRTICAITKYDKKKDIDLVWHYIHTMINQTAQS